MVQPPRWLLVAASILIGLAAVSTVDPLVTRGARQATPTVASSVVASGLTNPRGFTWDRTGQLLVASAGAPDASAGVDAIGPDGTVGTRIVDGFPSARVAFGGLAGIADVVVWNEVRYFLAAGGTTGRGQPANGVYRVEPDGATTLIADISAFVPVNPVSVRPPDYDPDGVPHALAVVDEAFWITDGNNSQVLRAGLDGVVTRVADLSSGHTIPTGIVADPAAEGGAFVALFTPAPYPNGAAKVIHVTVDGVVTDALTGLTTAIDVAIGPDGALYALEMATGTTETKPYVAPNTGRVVRRADDGTARPVVTGLNFPVSLAFDPEGHLYVALPAFGADGGEGQILRIADPFADPTSATPITA